MTPNPKDQEDVHVLSHGVGIQTVTISLMAAHGLITPMPKAAFFSDTTDEGAQTYAYRDYLKPLLPFPLHTVSIGSLELAITSPRISKKTGKGYIKPSIPAFFKGEGLKLKRGRGHRHCTADFKIEPVKRAANLIRGGRKVIMWIGISTDEALRAKPSSVDWIENRHPLLELGMSRDDCVDWLIKEGYSIPPKSSCVYCPFHSNEEWLRIQSEDPDGFKKAVRVESAYQEAAKSAFDRVPYFHSSCVPLGQVDFAALERARKDNREVQLNMFTNECEGMCGV